MQQINFNNIQRNNRIRVDYGNLQELAESLYEHGFIHPVCLNEEQELIAGGRRSAALEFLRNNPEVYPPDDAHNSMKSCLATGNMDYGVHFTIRPTLTYDELGELELVENIQRKQFSWQEEVLAVAKVHQAKVKEAHKADNNWSQAQTGRLLKIAVGNVNYTLLLAKELSDLDSPLWSCEKITDALQEIAKAKLDDAQKILAERTMARASQQPVVSNPIEFENDEDDGFFISSDSGVNAVTNDVVETAETIDTKQVVEISKAISRMTFPGRAEDWFDLGEKVDHIITDPPYGIDMNNLIMDDIDKIEDTHNAKENEDNFKDWLQGCYKKLKDNGFCIWWCDYMHFRYLHDLATEVGFKVCRWPFVWIKTSPCANQAAHYNMTKSHECAIIMRKGKAQLQKPQSQTHWLGQLDQYEKSLFASHPFTKPSELWIKLIEAVSFEGQTIGDPFSGRGSCPRAALLCNRHISTAEIDESHYNHQVVVLTELLESKLNTNNETE